MEIIDLGSKNSLIGNIMLQLRDVSVQNNKSIFRANIEKLGQIIAYEISKTLNFEEKEIITPLGSKTMSVISSKIVVASIMRAGLPLHNGLLSYFTEAESIFIAAYRQYSSETNFDIQTDYISGPEVNGKILLLADPMLATAASIVKTYHQLSQKSKPLYTHIVSVISAQQGLDNLIKNLADEDITVWTCAVDAELNRHGYIVPGLGDAGDLAFGAK